MAKTKGPLLSMEAHGSLMKTLNFSQRKSGSQCRKYNKPLKDPTPAQRGQRRLTEFLVAQWQNMSGADKATWATNAAASGLSLPGYHYFLREAQRDLYTHHGLCGYWSFNQIVNGKVLDISGNGNHGTLGPSYPSNVPTLVNSKNNRLSKALSYDGNDDRVIVPNAATLNPTSEITISVLAYPTSFLDHWRRIVDKGYDAQYQLFFDKGTGPRKATFALKINGVWRGKYVCLCALNKWTFIDSTYDGNRIRGYRNGVLYDTSDSYPGTIATTNNSLGLGSRPTFGSPYSGVLDEICIYKRCLSGAEILARYKFATTKV